MWTQVAPVAFKNIGWKFYMVFISCCVASATIMYFTFPDTLNKPLEEVAAMFGDDDLVAVYQRDLVVGSDQDVTATTEEKPAELKKTPTTWSGYNSPQVDF
jgi:hypothetical protein